MILSEEQLKESCVSLLKAMAKKQYSNDLMESVFGFLTIIQTQEKKTEMLQKMIEIAETEPSVEEGYYKMSDLFTEMYYGTPPKS